MHILHALFTHAQGGLGQAHVNTTEALIAKGHKVTALMHRDSPYCKAITVLGADMRTLQPTGFYDIIAVWKIRRLLKELQPDVIIAHNARAIALLSFAARGTGIMVCGATHSYKTPRTMSAGVLVALSEHMRQHFVSAGYKRRVEVIPNLIHLPEKSVTRPRRNPVVIGAIGRLTIEKGFDIFVRALRSLKNSGAEFTARIGGDGEEMQALKKLATELALDSHIKWDGWVKDKAAFYRDIDITCVPSREESFSLIVLESLANCVPIVASDAPGPASIITSGIDGVIVPRGDSDAMAQALKKLVDRPDLARNMADEGWQRVQEFGFEAVAARWDNLLRSIV